MLHYPGRWSLLPRVETSRSVDRSDGLAHQLLDGRLDSRRHAGHRVLGGPHVLLVEVRNVAEAERRVAHAELGAGLEEAHDLAVLVGVGRHAVPGLRP